MEDQRQWLCLKNGDYDSNYDLFFRTKECVVRQRGRYVTALTKTVHKKIKDFLDFLPTFFFTFLKSFHNSVALYKKRV